MDQEIYQQLAEAYKRGLRNMRDAAKVLSDEDWRIHDPHAQLRFDLTQAFTKLFALVIAYDGDLRCFSLPKGQELLRKCIYVYHALAQQVNIDELGIDIEDDVAFLMQYLRE